MTTIAGCSICDQSLTKEGGQGQQLNADKTRAVFTSCFHVFHRTCISEWFNKEPGPDGSCPICRRPNKNKHFYKLYLSEIDTSDLQLDNLIAIRQELEVFRNQQPTPEEALNSQGDLENARIDFDIKEKSFLCRELNYEAKLKSSQAETADAEQRATIAQAQTANAEQQATIAQVQTAAAEQRATNAQAQTAAAKQRVTIAQTQTATAEQRAATAQKSAIEAEIRAKQAEDKLKQLELISKLDASIASQSAKLAESRVKSAYSLVRAAKDRAVVAERRANEADSRFHSSEERAQAATTRAYNAEAGVKTLLQRIVALGTLQEKSEEGKIAAEAKCTMLSEEAAEYRKTVEAVLCSLNAVQDKVGATRRQSIEAQEPIKPKGPCSSKDSSYSSSPATGKDDGETSDVAEPNSSDRSLKRSDSKADFHYYPTSKRAKNAEKFHGVTDSIKSEIV